jgi:hypothetical protein
VRMEPEEKLRWIDFAARFVRASIPIKTQLPLFEPSREKIVPVVLPHIRSIYHHSRESTQSDITSEIVKVLCFGAYHSQHPLSEQMLQYVRSTSEKLSNRDRLIAVTWELLYFCQSDHFVGKESQKPFLATLNLRQLVTEPPQSEPYHFAEHSLREMVLGKSGNGTTTSFEEEHALILQLAVALGLHCKHTNMDVMIPQDSSGLETWVTSFLTDVITIRKPSAAYNELENTIAPLQDLYICTSIKHDDRMPGVVSEQAARILDCFTKLASVRRFCDLLSDTLSEFTLQCESTIVVGLICKILKIKRSPTSTISMWNHFSAPIAALCSKPESSEDIESVLDTLTTFRELETALLVSQQPYSRVATKLGRVAYDKEWNEFLEIVRVLLPLKDFESKRWLSTFLCPGGVGYHIKERNF